MGNREIIRVEAKSGAAETPSNHGNNYGFVKCLIDF
jgi:hypothetical protein